MHSHSPSGIIAGLTSLGIALWSHMFAEWPLLQNMSYLAATIAAVVSVYFMIKKRGK